MGQGKGVGGQDAQQVAIIDGSTVITGSYNWTTTAELVNHENLIVFTNAQKVASAYLREFHLLWNR